MLLEVLIRFECADLVSEGKKAKNELKLGKLKRESRQNQQKKMKQIGLKIAENWKNHCCKIL